MHQFFYSDLAYMASTEASSSSSSSSVSAQNSPFPLRILEVLIISTMEIIQEFELFLSHLLETIINPGRDR